MTNNILLQLMKPLMLPNCCLKTAELLVYTTSIITRGLRIETPRLAGTKTEVMKRDRKPPSEKNQELRRPSSPGTSVHSQKTGSTRYLQNRHDYTLKYFRWSWLLSSGESWERSCSWFGFKSPVICSSWAGVTMTAWASCFRTSCSPTWTVQSSSSSSLICGASASSWWRLKPASWVPSGCSSTPSFFHFYCWEDSERTTGHKKSHHVFTTCKARITWLLKLHQTPQIIWLQRRVTPSFRYVQSHHQQKTSRCYLWSYGPAVAGA